MFAFFRVQIRLWYAELMRKPGRLDGVTRRILVGCVSVSLVRMQGAGLSGGGVRKSLQIHLLFLSVASETPETSFSLLWPVLAGAAEGRRN